MDLNQNLFHKDLESRLKISVAEFEDQIKQKGIDKNAVFQDEFLGLVAENLNYNVFTFFIQRCKEQVEKDFESLKVDNLEKKKKNDSLNKLLSNRNSAIEDYLRKIKAKEAKVQNLNEELEVSKSKIRTLEDNLKLEKEANVKLSRNNIDLLKVKEQYEKLSKKNNEDEYLRTEFGKGMYKLVEKVRDGLNEKVKGFECKEDNENIDHFSESQIFEKIQAKIFKIYKAIKKLKF